MPLFEFRALRGSEVVSGRMRAEDALTARRYLDQTYDRVLAIEPVSEQKDEFLPLPWNRVPVTALAACMRQFSVLLGAGVPLSRALEILAQGDSEILNQRVARVRQDVGGGMSLTAALARHPEVFPADVVSLVRAGELGGTLGRTLAKIADNLEKAAGLRQRLVSALTYPAVVLIIALAVTWLFLFWVMPALNPIFETLGVDMPVLTRAVVGFTRGLRSPWLLLSGIGVSVLAVSFGYNYFFKTEEGVRLWWRALHMVPMLGVALRKLSLSRALFAMAAMLTSGVKIGQALAVAAQITQEPELRAAFEGVTERITGGTSLTDAMVSETVFPRMVSQMVAVGEDSGQMAEIMQSTADTYEMEVDLFMSGMLALLEPFVLIVLGVVATLVLLAAFLPLLQLMSAF